MSKIWEFFDTMDELVYVTDMDNYDLIYMNQKALRAYDFHSLEEIAIDAGRQEQQDSRMNLEAKINEGFRVALQQETPSQTLEVLLEYTGKALGSERTYIFERNERGCDDNTYEWVADGITPKKGILQNLPAEVCGNWYQSFRTDRQIVIKETEDIREINPPEKLLDYASDMLQIMAHFIISSLKRRNLLRQLKEMSYFDQLTQIGNRHAMTEYINSLQNGQSLGVVYCDVTGLKQVNDRKGHDAGDRLLTDACECLKKSFGKYGLFRVGGDELLAVCAGIGETALWQGVEQLKKDLQDRSVHMAVGGIWEKDSAGGVKGLITEAEKRMYRDKAAYYQKYGVDRRHQLELEVWTKA